jgi:hypothetical protein
MPQEAWVPAADVPVVLGEVIALHRMAGSSAHKAAHKKYSSSRFHAVAAIEPLAH